MRTTGTIGWLLTVALVGAGYAAAAGPEPAAGGAGEPAAGPDAPPAWVGDKNLAPPVNLRNFATGLYNYGKDKIGISGAVRAWDPVNGELLWIGGACGSMASGFAGNWRTADGKVWSAAEWASAVLDPLREKCLAARLPARDGENAARNVHFSDLGAEEAAAMRGRPAQLLGEAVGLAGEAVKALDAAGAAGGWEKQSVGRAQLAAKEALARIEEAQAGFADGRVSAELLAKCFDGQWRLDEAAACLAAAPGALMDACAAYDPDHRRIVLFGGNHGDYVTNDTWVYDCAKRAWTRVWSGTAPEPRCGAALAWDAEAKRARLAGGSTPIDRFKAQAASMPLKAGDAEWLLDVAAGEWSGAGGTAPGSRTYATVWKAHDPRWYDSEEKGSRAETKKWHDALKPNTWTLVPAPRGGRVMTPQSWGTAPLDHDRDLIFSWSGGHCADVTDVMPTYHIAVNRWSIGYVPAYTGKGISYDGRPDCANHTYKHYAYDPVSRKIVSTSAGGTSVYNPDRADYDYNFDHNFQTPIYMTALVGTPRGVYLWKAGALRLFDEKARQWNAVKVSGKVPEPGTDSYGIVYDSKRDALWLMNGTGYGKKGVNVWKLELDTLALEAIQAGGYEDVAAKTGPGRESVYLPDADLVVLNVFVEGKQAAFDPGNRAWLLLNIDKPADKNLADLGSVGGGGMSYDARRGLIWLTGMYGRMYVLKVDAGSLRRAHAP